MKHTIKKTLLLLAALIAALALVIIFFKPEGLFGKRTIKKV